MSRKILKVSISILFLIVAAVITVAAFFGIKHYWYEFRDKYLMGKYGVLEADIDEKKPARKTPAFKKDKQEQDRRVAIAPTNGRKYGVAPVEMPPYREDMTDKYGVAPVEIPPIMESKYGVAPVQRPPQDMMLKYGVAPVRPLKPVPVYDDNTEKYGVARIQKLEKENLLKNQIVYDVEELDQNLKN